MKQYSIISITFDEGCITQLFLDIYSFRYSLPDDSQSAGVTRPPVYVIRLRGEAVLWRGRQRDP